MKLTLTRSFEGLQGLNFPEVTQNQRNGTQVTLGSLTVWGPFLFMPLFLPSSSLHLLFLILAWNYTKCRQTSPPHPPHSPNSTFVLKPALNPQSGSPDIYENGQPARRAQTRCLGREAVPARLGGGRAPSGQANHSQSGWVLDSCLPW